MLGFPVVAKIASRRVQHKTDVGGVRLNLPNEDAVRRAFDDIVARAKQAGVPRRMDGVLIQPMITGGVETMIGVAADPLFGPLVGFGLGGIHVEVLGDVRFRIAPLTDRDADELLHEIRGFPLLEGYRGHPAADVDALRDVLLRVSRLADEVPEIAELDLNPVIALPARPRLPDRRRAHQGRADRQELTAVAARASRAILTHGPGLPPPSVIEAFRDSLRLLATRRFGTFWFASLLSSIGTWAQQVAEPWLLLTLGASSFLIGLDSFAMDAPVWLLTLVGGALADRADRRRVIAVFQSIQMLCPTAIVVLLVTGLVRAVDDHRVLGGGRRHGRACRCRRFSPSCRRLSSMTRSAVAWRSTPPSSTSHAFSGRRSPACSCPASG